MTPNIMKGDKGSMGLPNDRYDDPNHPRNKNPLTEQSTSQSSDAGYDNTSNLDGDHTAKAFEAGANSATNVVDLTDGIHEGAHQGGGAGDKATGQGTSIFGKDGLIGGAFKKQGAVGGIGEKVGGPFSSAGTVGKHFESDGKVGGTFQELAKKNEEH